MTEDEEKIDIITREHRFDIALLANRLLQVTDWLSEQNNTKEKMIGYFGASTGAAAALIAADKSSKKIYAIVSRGGKVDLASRFTNLKNVKCPILLIVGENDSQVIEMNQQTLKDFLENASTKQLIIIPGASHLFEKKGKLDEVAEKACHWFEKYPI